MKNKTKTTTITDPPPQHTLNISLRVKLPGAGIQQLTWACAIS